MNINNIYLTWQVLFTLKHRFTFRKQRDFVNKVEIVYLRYKQTKKLPKGSFFVCGEGGIRTRGTELPVRQFSKLLI